MHGVWRIRVPTYLPVCSQGAARTAGEKDIMACTRKAGAAGFNMSLSPDTLAAACETGERRRFKVPLLVLGRPNTTARLSVAFLICPVVLLVRGFVHPACSSTCPSGSTMSDVGTGPHPMRLAPRRRKRMLSQMRPGGHPSVKASPVLSSDGLANVFHRHCSATKGYRYLFLVSHGCITARFVQSNRFPPNDERNATQEQTNRWLQNGTLCTS